MRIHGFGVKTKIGLAVGPTIISFGLAALLSGATFAQQATQGQSGASAAPTAGLQEIVVTASKREERLQDVPLSIAALSSADLDARGISSAASLMSGDIPSLRVEPFAGNSSVLEIAMRGIINVNGLDITNENPLPIYIDGVYYGRQISAALDLNDLERIEVLRGPQGTLFGKNAAGGALNMVSKEPTGVFGVDLKAEEGNFGYWKGAAHVNFPAIGGLSAKIDFTATDNNGWTSNPAPGQQNYGETKSAGGKLTLLYKPSDSWRAEYAGDYTDLKTTEAWNAKIPNSDPKTSDPYNIWPNQTTTPRSEAFQTYRPYDPQTYVGHRLAFDFDLTGGLKLKSISAYRDDKAKLYNTAQNSSVVPGPFFSPGYTKFGDPNFANCLLGPVFCAGSFTGVIPIYDIKHHQFSEELQLVGKSEHIDWVAGLYYLQESGSQFQTTFFNTFLPNSLGGPFFPGPNGVPPGGFFPIVPNGSVLVSSYGFPGIGPNGFGPVGTAGAVVSSKSYAAFGQATWRPDGFDNKFSVTAGLRVGQDKKEALRPASGGNVWTQVTPLGPDGVAPGGLPCPQSPQCSPRISDSEVSPMLALAYKWTPDVSGYLRYSTGYQAPGLSVGSQTFKYVKATKVDSIELGTKSELAEHTVRLNIAVFYQEQHDPVENFQTVSASTVEFVSGPTFKVSGLEFDGTILPIPELTLGASLSLLHGSQAAFANSSGASGAYQLVHIPDWAASLSASYDIVHTSYGVVRFSVQGNGAASYYTNPGTTQAVPSYWLVDARLGLAEIPLGANGGHLEIAAWGKNLTDKSYRNFLYQAPGTVPGTNSTFSTYGEPRTYGLAASYKF